MDEQISTPPAPLTPPPAPARWVEVFGPDVEDKFSDAIAVIQPNGALLVVRWGSPRSAPLQGYAPGAWSLFRHRGDYTPRARPAKPAAPVSRPENPPERPIRHPASPTPSGKTYEDQLMEIGEGDRAAGASVHWLPVAVPTEKPARWWNRMAKN